MKPFFLTLGLLLLGQVAHAGLISYDESVSGDLGAIPTNLGIIDMAGNSTVTGSLPGTPPSDPDNFTFSIAAGISVDAISLAISLANGEVITSGVRDSTNNLFSDTASGSVGAYSLVDTFGPDTGALVGPSWGVDLVGSVIFGAKNYTWTIVTSGTATPPPPPCEPFPDCQTGGGGGGGGTGTVPAPGTLFLVGLGLIGLGSMRRLRLGS